MERHRVSVRTRILKYQQRIYKASTCQNVGKLFLQKKLINSLDAKLLAVHRVTSENKGKRTPGIDKQVAKTNRSKERLVKGLNLDGKAYPVRQVMVPKPGRTEKRPLGIPTIRDRAKQALASFALEPQWEARFEANSYGFRPGRSCQDAAEAIFSSIGNRRSTLGFKKYVLDADIKGCFNEIDHEYLMDTLDTLPEIRRQINSWLKAGGLEGFSSDNELSILPTERGTPQGGIISPLLMNIALHGMEIHLKNWVQTQTFPINSRSLRDKRSSLKVVRYADDFVVIHKDLHIIEGAKMEVEKWFAATSKLTLSEHKTKIVCTSQGFEFLGWRFMHITAGNGIPRAHIYPSRKSLKSIVTRIGETVRNNRAASAYVMVKRLRPIVMGWCNYHRFVECKDTFQKLDYLI